MTNAHRRFLAADDLLQLLGRAGIGSPLTGHGLLAGGTFNSVYRLGFDDRPALILKLSPDPSGAIMTYERGIVAAELAGVPWSGSGHPARGPLGAVVNQRLEEDLAELLARPVIRN